MVVIWVSLAHEPVRARRLGEDADQLADQHSLAELNYVHNNLNIV
jgi:hypothetical protein